MLKESITYKEKVLVLSWESAFVDHEVAFLVGWFVKVLLWVNFENVIRHLESDWLKFWGNILARVFNMAEGLIRSAIKVRESLLPLFSNLFKNIWRNRELGGSGIDNSWIWGILSWLLHWFFTIIHTLSLKSPGTKPVLEVLESLKTLSSSDNLGGVVSSEKGIWGFTHFFWGDGETDHSSINNSIILKRPEVMKLLLFHVLMWRESKNTIWIVTKSLRLVKGQELEESTFVFLELQFLLNSAQSAVSLEWLDASVILPYETLKLGWSISQLRGGLRQDFVRVRLVHIIGHSLASLVVLISLDKSTLERIVLLEFVVSSGLVIAKNGGDSQILWTSIENNSWWLRDWRSHINCSEIDGIILTIKWDLEL